jgi:rubrerythrin
MESIVEIIKMAIENEVRANVFYAKSSEITQDDASRMVFLELASMEDDHAQLLVKRFQSTLAEHGIDAGAFLLQTETDTSEVLRVEETELITNGEMRAVMEFAIKMEANARDSYLELAKRVTADDDRACFEDLAAEEQKHFDTLSKLRVSMDMPLDERPAL